MAVARFTPGEDGLFHCTEPGCEQPGYEHPQHLGLHLFHTHGVKGMRHDEEKKRRGRPPGAKNRPKVRSLSAEDVCATVLESVAPNGNIPIDAIASYNEWVRQTETFFNKILG